LQVCFSGSIQLCFRSPLFRLSSFEDTNHTIKLNAFNSRFHEHFAATMCICKPCSFLKGRWWVANCLLWVFSTQHSLDLTSKNKNPNQREMIRRQNFFFPNK
jgi:hypothetical protein